MSKVRLFELSKSLNVSGQALMDRLESLGIDHKKNLAASISQDDADKVKSSFDSEKAKPEHTAQKPLEQQPQQRDDRPRTNDIGRPERPRRQRPTMVAERPPERPASERPFAEKPVFDTSILERNQERQSQRSRDARPRLGDRPPRPDSRPGAPAGQRPQSPQGARLDAQPVKPVEANTQMEERNPKETMTENNTVKAGSVTGASQVQATPATVVTEQMKKPVQQEPTQQVQTPQQNQTPQQPQNQGQGSQPVAQNQTPVSQPSQNQPSQPAAQTTSQPTSQQPRPSQSQRPAGQRPQGDRPQGDRPYGDRPPRQYNDRPQGDRPPRQYGDRPQGDRPQGDRPPRQYGDRPQGDRPQGDRPPRQYGDRPQGQSDRPRQPYQGQRPAGQGYQGRTDRPQGDRPPRPYGDRPQGDRPQGDRPPRPYGDRPQGDRPPRPYGDRPQGDRPQGSYGDRPQRSGSFQRPGQSAGRPGQPGGGGRPGGGFQKDDRGGFGRRPEIPKTQGGRKDEATPPKKEDIAAKREEARREENRKRQLEQEKGEKAVVKQPKGKGVVKKPLEPVVVETKIITLPPVLTIKEFAEKIGKSGSDVVKHFFSKGKMLTITSDIDFETAQSAAEEFGILAEEEKEIDIFKDAFGEIGDDPDGITRPPVVVVMGHVDHGKTSLLDAIRNSNVTAGEAGGITQHIGAYTVAINNKPITFLDTPGHEAFTAMRMRGAQVTDIAILVVAADDGVMPQTIEAINHAKAAGVEIIVAINKIDKPAANPDRVKQELTQYGITAEDWGGETICVPVSAVQRTGIDQLLEMIILVSEMKELKANPKSPARGTIVEALLDKGRGPVATVLVQNGTLNVGDPIVAGGTYGKIRAMMDDKGKRVKKAGPSMPVEILGLPDVPQAGDMFYVSENERQARTLAEAIVAKGRVDMIKAAPQKVSLDDLFEQIQAGKVKDLNIIIKADVQGSVEAVRQSLERLSNDEVRVRIIHGGVGAVTESDVMLASASSAIVIGFNVRPELSAKSVAEAQQVDIRLYRIIYNAIEDIQAAMKGMLDPIFQEKILGHAQIRQLFKASGVGTIGGSYVTDGKILRNSKVRILRDNKVVYEGTLDTLRRFKDDVREVNTGFECGLVFTKFNDIKEGDVCEAYVMEEIER